MNGSGIPTELASRNPRLLGPDLGGNTFDFGLEEFARPSLPEPRDVNGPHVLSDKVDEPFGVWRVFPQRNAGDSRDPERRAQPVLASLGEADQPDAFVG